LYAQVGLEVELLSWRDDGRSIVQKVVEGGICAGSSEDNLIVSAVANGVRLKALGCMLQESPLVLMTKRSSGIRTLADLHGRRVAMHSDGIRILEAVLALEGIERSSVHVTEVGYDLGNLAGDRYAAVQGYAMSEPIELRAHGIDVVTIPVRHEQLHPYAQVFFASQATIDEAHPQLLSFLAASLAGWQLAITNCEEAAEIVAGMAPEGPGLAVERQVVDTLRAYALGNAGKRVGVFDRARWERNLASFARYGITPDRVAVADVVDTQFVDAIYGDSVVRPG
jgi:NitT/TauT family transport system substrate-binding protein